MDGLMSRRLFMKKTKKLLLINPRTSVSGAYYYRMVKIPPLGLAYIAAVTHRNWDVELIDEDVENFVFRKADLVGISTLTINVNRAYELAKMYRKRNIPVVLGGVHASLLPEEALKFCNSVVVGEGESIWPKVIRDFENNRLEKIYQGEFRSLENLPLPDRSIFEGKSYNIGVIQTSRGCPMNCNFCSVSVFNGKTYRMRPVQSVLDELELIKHKRVFIVDDNLIGYGEVAKRRVLELCKGMVNRKLNKIWGTQVSINFADDEDVLFYASKSGCKGVLVGFESMSEDSLKGIGKKENLKYSTGYYVDMVKKLHEFRINVVGSIVIGNDGDRCDIFDKTIDFFNLSMIDVPTMQLITPLPGTRLFEKLKREKRLLYTNFPEDWQYYTTNGRLTYIPLYLSRKQTEEGYKYMVKKLFSRKAIMYRSIKGTFYSRDFLWFPFCLKVNSFMKTFYSELFKRGI